MKVILPSIEILTPISNGGIEELKCIEQAARTCYKSEDSINKDGSSAKRLVSLLVANGHEAMLEHSQLSVRFICDRGVSHELVRHRLCSFAQESTRYCNYSKDKFGNELTFILPREFVRKWMDEVDDYSLGELDRFLEACSRGAPWADDYQFIKARSKEIKGLVLWVDAMEEAEKSYLAMIQHGCTPQLARSVLPTSIKTEIVVTANYREWRNLLRLRTGMDAHPDIRSLMETLVVLLGGKIPIVFDDIAETVLARHREEE